MEIEEALKNRTIRKFIMEVSGEEGIEVVEALNEEEMTDEELTEPVSFDLNTTRRALYDLYEARLAEYDRSRNDETGWITYTWRLRMDNLENAVRTQKREILDNLQERLDFEQGNVFYGCQAGHSKYLFEDAMDLNFRCPECGEQLVHIENDEFVGQLRKKIDDLQEGLAEA